MSVELVDGSVGEESQESDRVQWKLGRPLGHFLGFRVLGLGLQAGP